MSKKSNGLLLAGVLLAASALVGPAVAGENEAGELFASWGAVGETDLAAERGLGAVFNFDDINVNFDDIDIDNSTTFDDITDSFQANGVIATDNGVAIGAENSGPNAIDHSIAVSNTNVHASAVDDSMATDDGAIVGGDGTAVGNNNRGAVATGEGTTAIGEATDSFNTSKDEIQIGNAKTEQYLDISIGGDVGDSGAISNVNFSDMNGIGITNMNTAVGANFSTTFVLQVNVN